MDPSLFPAVVLPDWLMWDEWIKAFVEKNTISTYALSWVLYFIVTKTPWKGDDAFFARWFKRRKVGGGGGTQ